MTPEDDLERLQRLLDALERIRAIDGSPDIIEALLTAIEEVKSSQ